MSRGDCRVWFSDQAPLVVDLGYRQEGEEIDTALILPEATPMELDYDPAERPWHWEVNTTDDDEYGNSWKVGGVQPTHAEALTELAVACSIELAANWEHRA